MIKNCMYLLPVNGCLKNPQLDQKPLPSDLSLPLRKRQRTVKRKDMNVYKIVLTNFREKNLNRLGLLERYLLILVC